MQTKRAWSDPREALYYICDRVLTVFASKPRRIFNARDFHAYQRLGLQINQEMYLNKDMSDIIFATEEKSKVTNAVIQ